MTWMETMEDYFIWVLIQFIFKFIQFVDKGSCDSSNFFLNSFMIWIPIFLEIHFRFEPINF